MFKKILIANRGEIARRINATAQRMGIQTVAVFSEADANALHVTECDESVCLGPAQASQSYLNIDKVISAAKATGAKAIHPGYGFLSENAEFAKACARAGIVFIGPPADAIEIMGNKSQAKACALQAKVPLIPGYFGQDQSLDTLRSEAEKIGYPIMLKAVAGGGGKGIRSVASADQLLTALQSCQREALNAFGDAAVMIEKQIISPRHIEVQVFADTHGNAVHLFERDCSAQRRHQKVIEEAPAYGLTELQRQAMGLTAINVAKAVDYVGAGTVEFLLDAGGDFYFMEMNTRLQVEHPVTEMVTGFDLVEWQLRVAAGEPLPADQDHIHLTGHAMQARLYAENPANGFLPAIGKVVLWEGEQVLPKNQTVRLDGAIDSGSEISPHYDPMIGKLITWGRSREESRQVMLESLARLRCVGVKTNLRWLGALCGQPEFVQGGYDTGLINRMMQAGNPLSGSILSIETTSLAALAGLARWALQSVVPLNSASSNWIDPLAMLDGFSAATTLLRQDNWSVAEMMFQTHTHVALSNHGRAVVKGVVGHAVQGEHFEVLLNLYPDVTIDQEGVIRCQGMLGQDCFDLIWYQDELHVHLGMQQVLLNWQNPARFSSNDSAAGQGVMAPMPGKVFAVYVQVGQSVKQGDPLVGLEAMKMEHTLISPVDAVVDSIPYQVGEQVLEGARLIHFVEQE